MNFKNKVYLYPYLIAALSWLIPGSGHFYVKVKTRGVIFFILIIGLFISGLSLGAGIRVPEEEYTFISHLFNFVYFFNGLSFFIALAFGITRGNVTLPCFEIGQVCVLMAALLNILVMFSAFDYAREYFLHQNTDES
jgi:TM2 domain-containing membrane protein YozV